MMMPDVRRIVVPVDFSSSAQGSLDVACRIARERDAEVVLFHAFERPSLPQSATGAHLLSAIAEQEQQAEHRLRALSASARHCGVRVEAVVREGAPADAIVRYVRECHADMVIIATQGQSTISHEEIGPVADAVVRTCCCPVLLLPGARRAQLQASA